MTIEPNKIRNAPATYDFELTEGDLEYYSTTVSESESCNVCYGPCRCDQPGGDGYCQTVADVSYPRLPSLRDT